MVGAHAAPTCLHRGALIMPYAEINGVCLWFEDSATPGPPVLLLHELGGSSESWGQVAPLLAANRRVVAMDYRGAGRSEKPVAPFTLDRLADDAAGLLGSLGIARADVIGGALGALVGLKLAGRAPGRLRRLVLATVAAETGGRTAEYVLARAHRVRREGMRVAVDASLDNAFPPAFAAAKEWYRPRWLANDPAGYAALSEALCRTDLGPAVWAAVQAPTLVVSGRHDFIWPPAAGQDAAARIAGAQVEVLEEAGHFPHLQTPAALAALIERFL
jgi:3-oxoadipate enol-lactonase